MFWFTIALIFGFFDAHYFIRGVVLYLFCRLRKQVKAAKDPLKESVLHGVCTTHDLDFFLHMSNARYLRECDFGRAKLWMETEIRAAASKLGGGMTLGGTTVRYRKSLQLFDRYKIRTKLLCWDQKAFYLEQRIERNSDKFVSAIILAKQSLIKVAPSQVLKEVTGNEVASPAFPEEVTKWIEMNQISSEKLKKN